MKSWLLIVTVLLSGPACADLFKCSESGKIVYQDRPCEKDSKQVGSVVDPAARREVAEAKAADARRKEADKQQKEVSQKIDDQFNYVPPRIGASESDLLKSLKAFRNSNNGFDGVEVSETKDALGEHRHYRIVDYAETKRWHVYVKNGIVASVSSR